MHDCIDICPDRARWSAHGHQGQARLAPFCPMGILPQ